MQSGIIVIYDWDRTSIFKHAIIYLYNINIVSNRNVYCIGGPAKRVGDVVEVCLVSYSMHMITY